MTDDKMISVKLPRDLYDDLVARAEADDRTVAATIREALRRMLRPAPVAYTPRAPWEFVPINVPVNPIVTWTSSHTNDADRLAAELGVQAKKLGLERLS